MITNINPKYDGKIDLEEDLVAYIDESGDEGFDFTTKCSKWFVVGGVVTTFNESNNMLQSIKDYIAKHNPQKSINKMSFKELGHNQRKDVLTMVARNNYLGVCSVFYKPKIDPKDPMCTYPSMYFVAVKNLIERLSWIPQQFNKRRVHVIISNRNSIPVVNLKTYLFTNSVVADKNLTYFNKLGLVGLSTPQRINKLLLADYASASIFQCLEKTGEANIAEPIYFDLYLKKKLYSSNHSKYHGVWNNGFKCTPGDKDLIEHSGILEEGSHKL